MSDTCSDWQREGRMQLQSALGGLNNVSHALSFLDKNCYALNISNRVIAHSLSASSSSGGSGSMAKSDAVTLSQTCRSAKPNELTFRGTQNFTVDIWSYPVDTGSPVNMGWCVAAFFLLSFTFQLFAFCCGTKVSVPGR